jgi:hypothetical protein
MTMDPIANVKRQRELAAEFIAAADKGGDDTFDAVAAGVELAELSEALDRWRLQGGFDPYTSTDVFPAYSPEAAVAALGGDSEGWYLWHSGGGIMLARTEIFLGDPEPDDPPHIMVSEGEGEAAQGWLVCLYANSEDDGNRCVIVKDAHALRTAVAAFRASVERKEMAS